MNAPPEEMIAHARLAGTASPCAKSKRGVVIWNHRNQLVGAGCNAQPDGFVCDGSDSCRQKCRYLCTHAELAAIFDMFNLMSIRRTIDWDPGDCVLLHVKVVDGEIVPGGGPSCWQCSREILRLNFAGVWLYEEVGAMALGGGGVKAQSTAIGEWRFYSAYEFHRATLIANEFPVLT